MVGCDAEDVGAATWNTPSEYSGVGTRPMNVCCTTPEYPCALLPARDRRGTWGWRRALVGRGLRVGSVGVGVLRDLHAFSLLVTFMMGANQLGPMHPSELIIYIYIFSAHHSSSHLHVALCGATARTMRDSWEAGPCGRSSGSHTPAMNKGCIRGRSESATLCTVSYQHHVCDFIT